MILIQVLNCSVTNNMNNSYDISDLALQIISSGKNIALYLPFDLVEATPGKIYLTCHMTEITVMASLKLE